MLLERCDCSALFSSLVRRNVSTDENELLNGTLLLSRIEFVNDGDGNDGGSGVIVAGVVEVVVDRYDGILFNPCQRSSTAIGTISPRCFGLFGEPTNSVVSYKGICRFGAEKAATAGAVVLMAAEVVAVVIVVWTTDSIDVVVVVVVELSPRL